MYDVKIIAHRDANKFAPQNTLPAFKKATELKSDGFETDVHSTKDGELVICHNYDIDATSTGNGFIAEKTLAELKTYDFGSYFNEKFTGVRLPTLEEFLELAETADIEILNIELKPPKNGEKNLVSGTIEAVKRHGLFDKLLISSFDRKLLVEAKELCPDCKTAYLFPTLDRISGQTRIPTIKMITSAKVDAVHPMHRVTTKFFVKIMHRHGIAVNVWTPDKKKDILHMLKIGVDGVITDCPDVARQVAGR